MPAQWIVDYNETTGDFTISCGDGVVRTFNESDIPGNGFNAQRLAKIQERIQQNFFDVREVQADLPVEDPERTWNSAQFTSTYGGRVFLEGSVRVTRHTLLSSLSHDGTRFHWSIKSVV